MPHLEPEPQQWIHVRNWDRFQHYKRRNPPWIKNYTDLLSDENYLQLPEGCRAILHGLWLDYARTGCQLPVNTASLSRRLALRVTTPQLKRLSDAGFITLGASTMLAPRKQNAGPETETETEKNKPLRADARDPVDNSDDQPPSRRQSRQQPRDELWDILEAQFGSVAPRTNAHGKRNKAVADLRRHGATPDALRHALERWPRLFPSASITDTALATHYPQLVQGMSSGKGTGERATPCPECGVGGGLHIAGCSRVVTA